MKRVLRLTFVYVLLVYSSQVWADDKPREDESNPSGNRYRGLIVSAPTPPFPIPLPPDFYDAQEFETTENNRLGLSDGFSVCGDRLVARDEECDDGNRQSEDGCSDLCLLEDPLSCGNSQKDPGETCDDGNIRKGDGCSETCQNEGSCGNGVPEKGEECDDGNSTPGDGCSARCLSETDRPPEVPEKKLDPEMPPKDEPKPKDDSPPIPRPESDPKPDDNPEVDDRPNEKRETRYIPGRGITIPAGCLASCTMVRIFVNGQMEQEYELIGDRKLTGGTYSGPFGEVNCVTGKIVGQLGDNLSAIAESNSDGEVAQVVGCVV